MTFKSSSMPPAELYCGTLGDELVVLSISEVRVAERATAADTIVTADGPVHVRAGDFIVSMPSGERFPIKAEIYFGTYEVLSRVGQWYVGRRLIHPRRAWPITSSAAEFDYGPDRGRVSTTKGGWIYQSDETDYGLINADANRSAYTVVAAASELARFSWPQRFKRASMALSLLPMLLTAIALAALAQSDMHPALAHTLLAVEALCLACGAAAAGLMRSKKWALRAATTSGLDTARRFQVAVQALGYVPSHAFPAMSLWRVAQDDNLPDTRLKAEDVRALKLLIDETHELAHGDLQACRSAEHLVERSTWAAAAVVLASLAMVALTHLQIFKLIAIWLPSMVAVVHAWSWRRQFIRRAAVAAELLRELRFVRTKLVSLAPADVVPEDTEISAESIAAVRMLCKTIARHTQRELEFTAAEHVPVPV